MLRHWDTLSRFECRTAVARAQSFNSNINAMRQYITYCSTVQVWICWTVQDWITVADFPVTGLELMRWNLQIRVSNWKFWHSMNPFVNAHVNHWWIIWWIHDSNSTIFCSWQYLSPHFGAGSTPLHWAARYGHAPIVRPCRQVPSKGPGNLTLRTLWTGYFWSPKRTRITKTAWVIQLCMRLAGSTIASSSFLWYFFLERFTAFQAFAP